MDIPILYKVNDDLVEEASTFIYDVSIYKLYKGGAFLADTQLYTSNKHLKVPKTTIKRFKNYSIARYVDLIGAPKEFLNNYEKRTLSTHHK